MEETTLILGPEYDDDLREALLSVLRDLGAKMISHERGVAGSQDLQLACFELQGSRLHVESETYIGLSIRGQSELVLLIESRLRNCKL